MSNEREDRIDEAPVISGHSLGQVRDTPMITYVSEAGLAKRRVDRVPVEAPRTTWSQTFRPLAVVAFLCLAVGACADAATQSAWWHEMKHQELRTYHQLGVLTGRIFVKDAFQEAAR
jgi:hypothetical protein